MNRFFVDRNNVSFDERNIVINDSEDIKHITKVLRLSIGEELEICDGQNKEYIVEIINIGKDKIECKVNSKNISLREAFIDITLFQALPKSNKMDLIVQKNVEIGVKEIVPIVTSRCVTKIKDVKAENKKINRWQKIANEAAKQCKRGVLPKIDKVINFEELKEISRNFDLLLIPYELEDSVGIRRALKGKSNIKKIGIIIGPEGGFTEKEVLKAMEWGAISVSLGPRILRTETAGLAASTIIMYQLGDLGGK